MDDPTRPVRVVVGKTCSCAHFFLPWVLSGILVSRVFAAQGPWARAPGNRRWSSLATVERPRTAQRRPSHGHAERRQPTEAARLMQPSSMCHHSLVTPCRSSLCTLARSAVGGTSRATIRNLSMPSPSTPSLWNALITLCRAAPEPPSRRTMRRMVQFSERRTTSPAHHTPSSSGWVATTSPQAMPSTRAGHDGRPVTTMPEPSAWEAKGVYGRSPNRPVAMPCRGLSLRRPAPRCSPWFPARSGTGLARPRRQAMRQVPLGRSRP